MFYITRKVLMYLYLKLQNFELFEFVNFHSFCFIEHLFPFILVTQNFNSSLKNNFPICALKNFEFLLTQFRFIRVDVFISLLFSFFSGKSQ